MEFRNKLLVLITAAALSLPCTGTADLRELQSLDGKWQIAFDKKNEGRAAKWHIQEVFSKLKNKRDINVPSCWEEIEQDYEGVAFYGKRFKISNDWKNKTIHLQFDAVNYITEVYLNDYLVGRHEGGYGPFEFRIDDLLNYGKENFLSIRVLGPIVAENKVIEGIGPNDMPHWRGAITGGIWQSVRLVVTGKVFIDDVFIVPQLKDNTAHIQMTFENAEHVARETKAVVSILSGIKKNEEVAKKTIPIKLVPGQNKTDLTISIPNARYWSPKDPHLYTAKITIPGQDEKIIRFGMRELTIRNKRFELNGKPIYIKAAFFEGLYPTKLALPDNDEMARREIQLAIDAGFNMIRPWRKPPPPMWLDMCDEMGVMVVGGFPIECMRRWPTVTPGLNARIEYTVRSGVTRDRNRACIVQWEIFNEIHRTELKRLKHPMSMLARELDPSRLILDESGGFAGGANIYLPGKYEPVKFNDVHSYPGAPLSDKSYDRFLTLSKTPAELNAMKLKPISMKSGTAEGLLTVVSEIGYGSLPDLVDNIERFEKSGNPLTPTYRYHKQMAKWIRSALKESGMDSVYPDLKEFCLDQQEIHSQGNKRMIEAIRSNSSTGGYAVHALTGGDWVIGAGLLDLFRNPKGSYWGTKEANQERYLALQVRPRNVYSEQGAKVTVTGINELEDVSGKLSVEIFSKKGKSVYHSEKDVSLLGQGISYLFEEKLDAKKMSGSYDVKTKLLDKNGTLIAKNTVEIDVFNSKQLKTPKTKIAIIDTTNELRPFLKKSGIDFVEFDESTPENMIVFTGRAIAKTPKDKDKFKALESFVKKGGTAVYLETILRVPGNFWTRRLPQFPIFPVKANTEASFGLWVGVPHIVTDHPIFKGLPTECMMGQEYANIFAPHTLSNIEGEIIVGSVSHGFYGNNDNLKNYKGPSPAWYGMDLGVIQHGKGKYILSALRIVENIGTDPIADKILFNMIDWTNK